MGDAGVYGNPFELFSGPAMQIRDGSRFATTFVLGYCSDNLGYLPRTEDLDRAGAVAGTGAGPGPHLWAYGITISNVDRGEVDRLVQDAVAALAKSAEGQPATGQAMPSSPRSARGS